MIPTVKLERFVLNGVIGEGAEFQVFAAADTETGGAVVVKRPHPTLVERRMHRDVEQALARALALREQLGDSLPHVSRLIGYTPAGNHDTYFGDSLKQGYTVAVEERARGLPLVGSAVDGIKGLPIALPQNLFALHPLVPHRQRGIFTIPKDIMDVAQVFHGAGLVLLDLRPQNVFYDPKKAAITVIDVGNATPERPATRRRPPLDLHDFYLELFQWYTTPAGPPSDAAQYGAPHGTRSVSVFDRDLGALIEEFAAAPSEPWRAAAARILGKVRQRGYGSFDEFREEFEGYLALVEERYALLAGLTQQAQAWKKAREGLADPYWRKFLFDPEVDLVHYGSP